MCASKVLSSAGETLLWQQKEEISITKQSLAKVEEQNDQMTCQTCCKSCRADFSICGNCHVECASCQWRHIEHHKICAYCRVAFPDPKLALGSQATKYLSQLIGEENITVSLQLTTKPIINIS